MGSEAAMSDRSAPSSVASLFLVPEGQNIHRLVRRLVAVQSHIAGVPEGHHQFAQLGHFRKRAAHVGSRFQQPELLLNDPAGPSGGFRSLGGQKPSASLQAFRCAFGNDYSWHSGTVFSSSVPQVSNHARTSGPVRCRPVSW